MTNKTYCRCINCQKVLEITKEGMDYAQVDCPSCGYSNELNDHRLDWWQGANWWEAEYDDADIG